MPPVSKEIVDNAVNLYGKVWTTQNVTLLPQLFTEDCVYIERVLDTKATFVGLPAIQEYWKRQIVGKQDDIRFRHLSQRMIRDADRPIAVVTWMAEIGRNRREQRGAAKTHKQVKFVQVARLEFGSDGRISSLEEYAQSMTGPGVVWPTLDLIHDEDYDKCWKDPLLSRQTQLPKHNTTPKATCNHCQHEFSSRTQLFKHLKHTWQEANSKCISIVPPKWMWISISLGYTNHEDIENRLQSLLIACLPKDEASTGIDFKSMTWAVPPKWSLSAVVNVVSIKVLDTAWKILQDHTQPTRGCLVVSTPACILRIHRMVVVDRPCVSERRELEKYEAFLPWRLLQCEELGDDYDLHIAKSSIAATDENNSSATPTTLGWRRQDYHQLQHRKPLDQTPAGEYAHAETPHRLRICTRILKDGGRETGVSDFFDDPGQFKIRLRCSTLDRPYHFYCRVSVSMRQPFGLCVESIVALLLQFARDTTMTEDQLREQALQISQRLIDEKSAQGITTLPSDFCVLLEPALNRYEVKAGVQLCGGHSDELSPSFRAARDSMDAMEHEIIQVLTSKLPQLQEWMEQVYKDA